MWCDLIGRVDPHVKVLPPRDTACQCTVVQHTRHCLDAQQLSMTNLLNPIRKQDAVNVNYRE